MPRKKREESPTGLYHWISRGINRKNLFRKSEDYSFFLNLLESCSKEFNVQIYHYCLMTNHVHILIYSPSLESLIKFSHFLKRKYAYYQSRVYKISGATFERMYKSKPISEDTYLIECARYIDRNPLRAGLVNHPSEYLYSSYKFYAEGAENSIITKSPAYLELSEKENERRNIYSDYVSKSRPQEEFASSSSLDF